MGGWRVGSWVVVVLVGGCLGDGVAGQDEAETCYGPGSILGAVAGTLIVTVGLLASAFFLYKMYWKNRKGKQLVLMTDAENPQDQYAFDNPCFREATPMKHVEEEKRGLRVERSKWAGWPPVHAFGRQQRSERPTSMDDSCVKDPRLRAVTLKSHDFTGLGFNICGNMRDGIFVKDVLHRGPAFESGCINTGDRIDSVCISFRNMVFEDALTILSYASPYDVQVQVENDSCSRPSTLMRSKRESNAVNCSDRILHPKFTRSQSASHLKEAGSGGSKKVGQHGGPTPEKNRVNHSGSKWQDFGEYPSVKVSSPGNRAKSQRTSPLVGRKESPRADGRKREGEPLQGKSPEPQNKLHKFGIKVLPISINPKMGVQSVTGAKRAGSERSPGKEKPEKALKPKEPSRNASPVDEKLSAGDETDASKENMKAMLAKGFLSLKEKINQNTLGRKKKGEEEGEGGGGGEGEEGEREGEGKGEGEEKVEGGGGGLEEGKGGSGEEGGSGGVNVGGGGECPVPRRRSSVTCGVKAYEQSQQSHMNVPEEVFRAGDVARSNRKSVAEGRKSGGESEWEGEREGVGAGRLVEEAGSESSESSDRESTKDEARRPKRSKGKAPSPPRQGATSKEMNEIKSEAELMKDETRIFEPEAKTMPPKDSEEHLHPNYDSDSDADPVATPKDTPGNKIELNATQVTVHHSPAGDANDDDMEPGRKAASLGDLSRLDSDQPLSIVLERAVSLDLTEGTAQGGKKRKAPLPPSEEFPAVFDDLGYRKEPRLEGLSTFQRRLKKSSDFGTLEDAFNDEPRPLEIEINKLAPRDLSAAHSHNIQEFSSWLAECRRPKAPEGDPRITSTSFVNINSTDCSDDDSRSDDKCRIQGGNVSFRVNGTSSSDNNNLPPPPTSRTVVVISQPNSLEPPIPDNPTPSSSDPNGPDDLTPSPPKLPTTPIPTTLTAPNTPSSTLSSPLSSPLTYVTEIKVSTPSTNSFADRIHTFDSLKPLLSPFPKILPNASNVPIRTMKSETGQRVLATIQSLAKESSSSSSSSSSPSSPSAKTPQIEYAKRMAELFSNPRRNQANLGPGDPPDADVPHPNVSGLYLKPSKDYPPSRKVPPVVPPRKIEPSPPGRATVTVGLPAPAPESPERNVVTFSSFVGRARSEDPEVPSKISFNVRGSQGEVNGRQDGLVPVNSSATKIVLDSRDGKDGL